MDKKAIDKILCEMDLILMSHASVLQYPLCYKKKNNY